MSVQIFHLKTQLGTNSKNVHIYFFLILTLVNVYILKDAIRKVLQYIRELNKIENSFDHSYVEQGDLISNGTLSIPIKHLLYVRNFKQILFAQFQKISEALGTFLGRNTSK